MGIMGWKLSSSNYFVLNKGKNDVTVTVKFVYFTPVLSLAFESYPVATSDWLCMVNMIKTLALQSYTFFTTDDWEQVSFNTI